MAHARRPSVVHGAAADRPYWSQVLRSLREARGITQDGWAAQLGFGRATVKRWEAGEAVPAADAEGALVATCREKGLFRTFEQGPLRGVTVTPEFLRDLFAEARLGGGPSQPESPAVVQEGPTRAGSAAQVPANAGGAATVSAHRPTVLGEAAPAERRQLTIMLCDLVDSTPLSPQLDPEELREVLQAYHDACAVVIERFAGHIAQYLGDGLLVYFGYPQAHEDDAQRAVHAALEMVAAIGQLNARLEQQRGVRLAVRVGVHTGLVVVGEIGGGVRHEQLALGDTPNIAARLQQEAAPDTVVISPATRRLVEGFFECRPLGARALKGIAEPLPLYQVLHATGAHSRLELAGPAGLTALVGREQEIGLLWERWQQVNEGDGQVVLLSGEPGIGKSRLVEVLKERVAGEPHALLECRCSPYHQHSALYPVTEMLARTFGFGPQDTAAAKLAKLDGMLRGYGLASGETVALFAALLSIPLAEPYALSALMPEQQKRRTLEAVLLLLLRMAARQPVLFVVEDLHWIDASTLELLDLVIDQTPTARILAVLTLRPEFTPPWPLRAHLAHLTLGRLRQKQVEVMVARVAGGKLLPDAVMQQITTRTDGVPLFVEELTKAVLESGVLWEHEDRYELRGLLFSPAIPTTLEGSLLARLDRLGEAKEVAQWGATLGREFSYALLRAVVPIDEAALQRELGRLVGAELLYQRGVPPQATYLFKHALVQEAAYQSLLKSRRQGYHQRIARVLAEGFPEVAESQPELLAHHFTEAGLGEQAIGYWQQAGQRAIERSASTEALAHLTRGLQVLKGLPHSAERPQQELELQTALGLVLMPARGYGSAEVEAVYTRALELCRQFGTTPRLFSVLRGLWELYDLRGDTRMARELAEELLRLASGMDDMGLLVIAHQVLGETLLWPGEFALAREHLEQGIALHDLQQHRTLAFQHGGYDAGVISRSWAAHALWYLGYPDQAVNRCQEALALAQALTHPHTLTFVLSHAAVLHQFRREPQPALERADAAVALATEHGFTFWVAFASIVRGWALAELGQAQAGIAQIQEGMAGYRAGGAELERPLWLALLSQACARAGQTEEAPTALAEGLAAVDQHGVYCYDAELRRLTGEQLLSRPAPDVQQAEACFHEAIDIARRQQAKSLELRAVTSLARLWQQQGKRSAARRMLAEVYDWFSEGFDTADLKAARHLLDEVRAGEIGE